MSEANSSVTTFAAGGVRAFESRTILRGWRSGIRALVSGFRFLTVRLGSSANSVLTPTRMASEPARSFMACARACPPVIHFDSPEAVAILPSRVIAALTVTNGVRCTIQ